MQGVLARFVLLATAVALVLLARPNEQLTAQRYEDEQASRGSADDVSLRSERRHTPVFRLACAETDDDDRNDALAESWRYAVLAASVRELAFGSGDGPAAPVRQPSAVSARGPPSVRS